MVLGVLLVLATEACTFTLKVDEVVPSETETLAFADFWKRLAGLECGYARRCLGDAFVEAELISQAECTSRGQAVYDDLRNGVTEAIAAGLITYDADAAQRCVDALSVRECAELDVSVWTCSASAIVGNARNGEACVRDLQCQSGSCVSDVQCPGTCVRRGANGASCTQHTECQSIACVDGRCAGLATPGQPCGGTSGNVCTFGNYCRGGSDTAAGRCVSARDVFSGAKNQRCEFDDNALELCEVGLRCAVVSTTEKRCLPAVSSGAACKPSLLSQCPAGQFCDAGTTLEGVCKPAPYQTGGPCLRLLGERLCARGNYCDAADTCQPERRVSEPCAGDADCYTTGRCIAGRCSDAVCVEGS